MKNRYSFFFVLFFFAFNTIDAQYYGYVERNINSQVDWSEINENLNKVLKEAALERVNQFNQCVEITNMVQELVLKSTFKSNIPSIEWFSISIQDITYKQIEKYKQILYSQKNLNYKTYQTEISNLISHFVYLNKQIYNLDLYYINTKNKLVSNNQSLYEFNSFDSLFTNTIYSISYINLTNEGFKFSLKNLLYYSKGNITMYDFYTFVKESSSGKYYNFQKELQTKIILDKAANFKRLQDIQILKDFVKNRDNYLLELSKQNKRKYLKDEKILMKNRNIPSNINIKSYIRFLVSKDSFRWSNSDIELLFILKLFYEKQVTYKSR